MAERVCESDGHVGMLLTDGSKIKIGPHAQFRAIYTETEYPNGGVVYSRINSRGQTLSVGEYKNLSSYHLFSHNVFDYNRNFTAPNGEIKGSVLVELNGRYIKRSRRSQIPIRFKSALEKAKKTQGYDEKALRDFFKE